MVSRTDVATRRQALAVYRNFLALVRNLQFNDTLEEIFRYRFIDLGTGLLDEPVYCSPPLSMMLSDH